MSDPKTYVLIPQPERGLQTAWSPFNMSSYENSFSNFRDIVIRDNAWISRFTDFSGSIGYGSGAIQHLYFYNVIDTATASATTNTALVSSIGNAPGPYALWLEVPGSGHTSITSTADPNDLCFRTIKNRCFVAGNGTDPLILTVFPSVNAYSWGKAGPTNDLSYTAFTQANNTDLGILFEPALASGTGGANTITDSGMHPYHASPAWDGKTAIFDNGTYPTDFYTIATSTTSVLTLTENLSGTGARNLKNVEVHYGSLSWGNISPKYAYAYYNPVTGHITNISPVLNVSEQNMKNVNVMISGIQCTNDPNYTKIVLFRTLLADGGTMMPMRCDLSSTQTGTATIDATGFIENTGVLAVTYQDFQSDNEVGNLIGAFDAAQLINNQPAPEDIQFFEYWDQRVWANTLSEPWRLRFSGDSIQIPLGVAEESWPDLNYLDIPANDGKITGIRVVGSSLLVCTNSCIYYVDASGGGYRLVRLSSRGQAVNHFAIDEHPGDSTTESASAIYVGADNRLWRHFPGGKVVDIGWQIQDKLDVVQRTGTNRPFIVRVLPLGKNWVGVVAIRNQANTGYNVFFYDFDASLWYDWGYGGIGSSTLTNAIGGGFNFVQNENAIYAGGNTSNTVYLIQDEANSSGLQPTFTTQPLDFGAPQAKKTIEAINVYVSDDSLTGWSAQIQYDRAGGFVAYPRATISGSPRYKGSGVMSFSCPVPKQFHFAELKVIWGTSTSVLVRTMKAEIVYRVQSTGEAGTPS